MHRWHAQVHLEKRLDDGRRRPHTLSEEQLHTMSFETREFSGAMLASLVNAAALRAGRAGREAITFNDLEQARGWRHALGYQGVGLVALYRWGLELGEGGARPSPSTTWSRSAGGDTL